MGYIDWLESLAAKETDKMVEGAMSTEDYECAMHSLLVLRQENATLRAEIKELKELLDAAHKDSEFFQKECKEPGEPMACGHFLANLQPTDGTGEVCIVCSEIDAAVAAEREKCAKLVEEHTCAHREEAGTWVLPVYRYHGISELCVDCKLIADTIRARGGHD